MFWKTFREKLLAKRGRLDHELDEELRTHIEIETEENIQAGMSFQNARAAALRTFGNLTQAKEASRDMWRFLPLEGLGQDVRFALRMLLKNPGLAGAAILTLALGIGANAAIFSVVNTVLFNSLPYPNPNRLVVLDEYKIDHGSRTVSWLDFQDWRNQAPAFEDMAAYRLSHVTLTGRDQPALLRVAEVSASFFKLLGLQPQLGRFFNDSEDQPGATPSVVITYSFWRSRFGANPHILGTAIDLDGKSYVVLGVLPPGLDFFEKPVNALLPVGLHGDEIVWNRRGFHPDLLVLGRLRHGVPLNTARSQMNVLMDHLDAQYPHSNAGMLASVTSLYQHRFGSIGPVLLMLFAAVGCVLLIAAVNVANLLLARGLSRQKEMATRTALGAARSRLVRQLLTESLILSLAAGLCGLVVAYFGLHFLLRMAPATVPGLAGTRIDAPVILFTTAVSLICGMVFGTAPALQASKVNLNVAFKQSDGRSSSGDVTRLRSLFLVSEVALALVLVAAAGLLVRSLIKAANVDPGFNPGRILAMDVLLPPSRYTTAQQQSLFFDQAVQRLQALPGVQSVGAAFCPPLVGVCADNAFMLADHAIGTVADLPTAASNIVVPGYLKALQVPLLEGRFFSELDNQESRRVAIVNETFARRYWPSQSAVNKQIKEGGPERNEPYRTVVGVVADLKQNGMDGKQQPEVFFPVTQFPFAPWDSLEAMTFVVRTEGDPQTVAEPAKNAVQEIDKDLPVTAVRTMADYMAQSLKRREFSTTLLGSFAILALLLAAIGIYGVMSWNVEQRKHEISTRMALGGRAADIFKLVLGQALSLTGAGVVLGLAASSACAHWLSSMVFGIKASDPMTFCFVAVLLATVAFLASYIPVRRATRIDPAAVLRSE